MRAGTELHPDLQQVLDYCSTFAPRRTAAAEVACRRAVQARIKHPYYVGLVLNLAPESADELMGLIPQLAVRHSISCSWQPALPRGGGLKRQAGLACPQTKRSARG